MIMETKDKNPGALQLLQCKCPRCRRGDMFETKNPYRLRQYMNMHETCAVCGQPFDIEVGFYYGSSYVSYALSITVCVVTFIAWWMIIGISINDNRVFGWLVFNSILLLALQPVLMRLARTGWLAFFVPYDPYWKIHPPKATERMNKGLKDAW